MKILHRLFVYTDTIDKDSRERAAKFLSIPGILEVRNSYRRAPDVLEHLTLESDEDIDEKSLRDYVMEPGYHNVHLVMTDAQWRELGIRPSLYGQCRVVSGQIITYGAAENRRSILKHYSDKIRAVFTEDTLMDWHELDHGIRTILKVLAPTTHAVFYGYKSADVGEKDSRRWVRKPYPLESWRALPWHKLPDQTPKRPALEKKLAQTQFNVLTFVGQLLQNMSYRMTAKPTLFAAAREYLGREASPKDLAPDELGCAESVTNIIDDVVPNFPVITGTWTLWEALKNDERFREVTLPMPGDIIISPTGTVKDAPYPGHVGLVSRDGKIMSNNSYNGLWEENYTLDSWNARYKKAGFPVIFYTLTK